MLEAFVQGKLTRLSQLSSKNLQNQSENGVGAAQNEQQLLQLSSSW